MTAPFLPGVRPSPAIVLALLLTVLAVLFALAPVHGEFYWSDAPRHALNGVFLKDFIANLPLDDPSAYAYRYYAQYPALTILFYPPLFYVISAPFYAVFGVSHATALGVVYLHYLAFAIASWRLFGFWLPGWRAPAAALMLVCAPEIAFWGRQIMLEIPAFAFMMFSALSFMHYRRHGRPVALYVSAALLVLGLYSKISIAFMAPVFVLVLLYERRLALLRDRHAWIALVLAALSLVPLVVLTLKFGQANVQSVTGVADSRVARDTLAGWIWYLQRMPAQLGWPLCIAALAGLSVLFRERGQTRTLQVRADALFWGRWLMLGYFFYSAIDLKEARHSLFILPPVVMLACVFVRYVERYSRSVVALGLWFLLPTLVLAQTLFYRPVFQVQGYREAVDFVARNASRDSNVMFSGYRDGAFIFNLRTREDRRDLGVVRADKLLLKVAVRRELGVTEKALSEDELRSEIDRLGVHYVVAQPGFWSDLEAMKRLERVLAAAPFELVARIATESNYPSSEQGLLIYRNTAIEGGTAASRKIDLPMINRSIEINR
mgnify:CR=1 FL=1